MEAYFIMKNSENIPCPSTSFFLSFFFFFVEMEFELGAGALPLEPLHQPFSVLGIFKIGS
jgi:hypothetical protein